MLAPHFSGRQTILKSAIELVSFQVHVQTLQSNGAAMEVSMCTVRKPNRGWHPWWCGNRVESQSAMELLSYCNSHLYWWIICSPIQSVFDPTLRVGDWRQVRPLRESCEPFLRCNSNKQKPTSPQGVPDLLYLFLPLNPFSMDTAFLFLFFSQ